MGQMTRTTALQQAQFAGRGKNNATEDLLRALVKGGTYQTYAGNPNSNVTPAGIGDRCFDSTNAVMYVAITAVNTGWVPMGITGLSLTELSQLQVSTIAAAGSAQSDATAIGGDGTFYVTASDGTKGVALPAAVAATVVRVVNAGTGKLKVYPVNGGNDTINTLTGSTGPITLLPGAYAVFVASSATQWYTNDDVSIMPTFPVVALAAAGSSSSDAAVITNNIVAVTGADDAVGVALPAAAIGLAVLVINTSASAALKVYPVDGGNDNINSLAEDAAFTLAPGRAAWFVATTAAQWYTAEDNALLPFSATATVAAAGTTAADATAMTIGVNVVTGADGVKGVALPAALEGFNVTVVNDRRNYALFVYPVNGGNDKINELPEDQRFILAPGKTATFRATSATQWYTDKEAGEPTVESHFTVFDDFLAAAIDTTDNWIVFKGTTAADDLAQTVAGVPEGQILMGNGAANDAQDKTVLSLILLSKGSLISLGQTVFECRVSFGAVTGCSWGFGLGDVLANATEVANYTVNSGVVADDAGIANAVSFVFDTDATAPTKWQMASTNAGTVGNAAAEEALASGPTANTYDVLRLEVDADGDARFYVNGVLEGTRLLAVATTALLIPYIWGDSAVDAQTAVDVHIDYIKFQGKRPSSDA